MGVYVPRNNSILGMLKQIVILASPFTILFFTHYIVTNVYASVCADLSLQGFLSSLVFTGSPFCGVLLQIINYSSNNYAIVVTGIGVTILGRLAACTKCSP